MVALLGQCLGVGAENSRVQHRVKIRDHTASNLGGQTIVFGVHDGHLSVKAVEEGEGARVGLASLTVVHEQDEGHVLVGDLKGTMEVLARMEAAGVDPLHLHHEADGAGVCHVEGGAGAHVVDKRIVLELATKVGGKALGVVGGRLGQVKDPVKAVQHGVIVLVALGLLQQLDGQRDDVAHLLDLSSVVELEAVHDAVVCLLGEGGAGNMGHGDDGRAQALGHVVSLDSLRRGATKRAGDDGSALL